MTQAERDRLVALKKAKKKLITQKQAAEELGLTERHVRRLLWEMKRKCQDSRRCRDDGILSVSLEGSTITDYAARNIDLRTRARATNRRLR
jgi:DNA-binding transcriptional regulator LsrR (DeoR family)